MDKPIAWACEHCFYWEAAQGIYAPLFHDDKTDMVEGIMGRCRFNAPTGTVNAYGKNFPLSHREDWCRHFTEDAPQ